MTKFNEEEEIKELLVAGEAYYKDLTKELEKAKSRIDALGKKAKPGQPIKVDTYNYDLIERKQQIVETICNNLRAYQPLYKALHIHNKNEQLQNSFKELTAMITATIQNTLRKTLQSPGNSLAFNDLEKRRKTGISGKFWSLWDKFLIKIKLPAPTVVGVKGAQFSKTMHGYFERKNRHEIEQEMKQRALRRPFLPMRGKK